MNILLIQLFVVILIKYIYDILTLSPQSFMFGFTIEFNPTPEVSQRAIFG